VSQEWNNFYNKDCFLHSVPADTYDPSFIFRDIILPRRAQWYSHIPEARLGTTKTFVNLDCRRPTGTSAIFNWTWVRPDAGQVQSPQEKNPIPSGLHSLDQCNIWTDQLFYCVWVLGLLYDNA
jgi:hypothetical protein